MEVKCEYCGSMIPDDCASCPNCGAPNENMNRGAANTPKTIAELEKWYKDHNLPPYETTRFFIGIDYKEPKAFGIYQDGDSFVVYKNKADGSRSIRYRGKDEDYAVNELYLKLKSEILNQKEHQMGRRGSGQRSASGSRSDSSGSSGSRSASSKARNYGFDKDWAKSVFHLFGIIIAVLGGIILLVHSLSGSFLMAIGALVIALLILLIGRRIFKEHKKAVLVVAAVVFVVLLALTAIFGHYRYVPRYYWYQNLPYVWYDDGYYSYDYGLGEYTALDEEDVPADLRNEAGKYQMNGSDAANAPDFKNSSYYDDSSWSDSVNFFSDDDDYDYSWDNDYDWDYGDTDWDSDW